MSRLIKTCFAGVGLCMTNLKLVIREFVGRLTPCESLGNERYFAGTLVLRDRGCQQKKLQNQQDVLQKQKAIAGRSLSLLPQT